MSTMESRSAKKEPLVLFKNHFGIVSKNDDYNNATTNVHRGGMIGSVANFSTDLKSKKLNIVECAKAMPMCYSEMDNSSLITLGALGKIDARREILKRHIMNVDNSSYEDACASFKKIEEEIDSYNLFLRLPSTVGLIGGMGLATVSIPLVFDLNTVQWFNEHYVTTDIPEQRDLETWLEVGAWSWNWMEPLLGHISFVLLCLQFSRAQILNLGLKPFTGFVKHQRGLRISAHFPQYNSRLIMDYSKAEDFASN